MRSDIIAASYSSLSNSSDGIAEVAFEDRSGSFQESGALKNTKIVGLQKPWVFHGFSRDCRVRKSSAECLNASEQMLQAAILDASEQMLGFCALLDLGNVQTILSCVQLREHPYPNHGSARVPRAYGDQSILAKACNRLPATAWPRLVSDKGKAGITATMSTTLSMSSLERLRPSEGRTRDLQPTSLARKASTAGGSLLRLSSSVRSKENSGKYES